MTDPTPNDDTPMRYPPGHFHSPIVNLKEIARRKAEIFRNNYQEIPGIDLREEQQLKLLFSWSSLDTEPMLNNMRDGKTRYTTEGQQSFNETDALVLHCMLRTIQPKRYVEIGCGYSSCMTLDTNEYCLHNEMQCTFIDPYQDILRSRMRDTDVTCMTIVEKPVQEVDIKLFQGLKRGDVLFIDSTHVLKTDSDVCHILLRILPTLQPGVWIHIHDIFWPFEYPEEWVTIGRNWNELYALRALLTDNPHYEIQFFTSYLQHTHPSAMAAVLPSCEGSGGSFWMRKKC